MFKLFNMCPLILVLILAIGATTSLAKDFTLGDINALPQANVEQYKGVQFELDKVYGFQGLVLQMTDDYIYAWNELSEAPFGLLNFIDKDAVKDLSLAKKSPIGAIIKFKGFKTVTLVSGEEERLPSFECVGFMGRDYKWHGTSAGEHDQTPHTENPPTEKSPPAGSKTAGAMVPREKSLAELKGELAALEVKIDAERKRFQDALNIINVLTNNKTRGVREGSIEYSRCQQASRIITEVEAGATDLKAKKAALMATIKELTEASTKEPSRP